MGSDFLPPRPELLWCPVVYPIAGPLLCEPGHSLTLTQASYMRALPVLRSLALAAMVVGPLAACTVKDSDTPPAAVAVPQAVAIPVAVPVPGPTRTDSVSTSTSTNTMQAPVMTPVVKSSTSTRVDSTGAVVRTDSSATVMTPVGPVVTSKTRTTTRRTTTTP